METMNDRWGDEADTPTPPSLGQVVVGLLLIAWGAELLIERIVGLDMSFIPLAAGVSLLSAYSRNGKFPFFVAGAAITGWGVGAMVGAPLPHALEDALGSFGTAAGFAFVGVRRPGAVWAFIVAAVFATFGIGSLGVGLASAIGDNTGRILLPAALVFGGGLLLFKPMLPKTTVRLGLVAAALVVVLSASAMGADWVDHDHHRVERVVPLPQFVEGRTIVLDLNSSDVTIREGRLLLRQQARSWFGDGPSLPDVEEFDDRIVIRDTSGFMRSSNYVLTVPGGTDLEITTDNGDIDGQLAWAGNQEAKVLTDNGDIDLIVLGDPTVDVNTDNGDVEVDGREYDDDVVVEGSGGRVTVMTDNGDVEIRRARR